MSRFGLRRRIKSRLGIGNEPTGGDQREERFEILFELPNGDRKTVETEAHYTLHMASQMLETPIEVGCPDGHCGGCLVDVMSDIGMQAMGDRERDVILEKHERQPESLERLACHARVLGPGVEVKVHKVWSMEDLRGE